jgi:hypothetical protein
MSGGLHNGNFRIYHIWNRVIGIYLMGDKKCRYLWRQLLMEMIINILVIIGMAWVISR